MRIKRPYYAIHQITTGQYTEGNEFVLPSGEVYAGPYHILPTGQYFTEFIPQTKSIELTLLRTVANQDVLLYNKLSEQTTNRYLVPVLKIPTLTVDDYKRGKIERYFCQKRNNPQFTIIEIDATQYNQFNSQNRPGINSALWNRLKIDWVISKIPIQDAEFINKQIIAANENRFTGLTLYLTDALEFYK